jgi:hypothetical protein
MVTVLASIVGFISSLIPDILRIIVEKQSHNRQLEIINQQIRAAEVGAGKAVGKITSASYANELKILYSTYKTGVTWVDSLNATVRPVLAYAFFCLYAFMKFKQYLILKNLEETAIFHEILWTVEDQAIFASIISFYFGQRSLSRAFNQLKRRK